MKYKMLIGFAGELSIITQISDSPIVPPRQGELVLIGEYRYEVSKVIWSFDIKNNSALIAVTLWHNKL